MCFFLGRDRIRISNPYCGGTVRAPHCRGQSVAATISLALAANRMPMIECSSCYRFEALRQLHCYPSKGGRPILPPGVKTHVIRWGEGQPDASHAHVQDYMSTDKDVVWLKGFTQSFYSFQQHWAQVCWALRPRLQIQEEAQRYFDGVLLRSGVEITSRTRVVTVHIRRGDYVSKSDYHGTLSREYYTNALQMIRTRVAKEDLAAAQEGLVVVVFGEQKEMAWCRENMQWTMKDGVKASICADAKGSRCRGELVDMYALGLGHWLIIANSSFSWWSHFFRLCRKKLGEGAGAGQVGQAAAEAWHLVASKVLAPRPLGATVFPYLWYTHKLKDLRQKTFDLMTTDDTIVANPKVLFEQQRALDGSATKQQGS